MEKLYIDGLAEIGKSIDSHITRFAAKIVNADIGLTDVQSTSGCKYQAFRTSRIAAVIQDAEWCQMLRKVVEPIREEIFQVHKMEKSSMSDLSLESSSLQYKKLEFLIIYLCHGKPDANYLRLNLDTICQQIVFNASKCPPRSKSKIIRHSSDKECPEIHYATIKLYSVIRSKSLVHMLFERGMVLSYDRILAFIHELSETAKALYNDSGDKVLPSTLRQGIFTIFVDDNADENRSSVLAAGHFHGTGVTLLQFLSEENSGIQRKRKTFKELQSVVPQSCESLKTFTTVKKIVDKLEFHYCVETINVPEKFMAANQHWD